MGAVMAARAEADNEMRVVAAVRTVMVVGITIINGNPAHRGVSQEHRVDPTPHPVAQLSPKSQVPRFKSE